MNWPSLLVHIRHAEPEIRPGVSDRDTGLSKRGHEHARSIGVLMHERFGAFDAVICSDFFRSRQTAEHVLEPYSREERAKVSFCQSSLLNERDLGTAFGVSRDDFEERFPELYIKLVGGGEIEAEYPEGESLANGVFVRVGKLLKDELPKWAGKKVCLVGHWGTSLAVRKYLEGLCDQEILEAMAYEHPPHCSLLVFESPSDGSEWASSDIPDSRMALKHKNLLLCGPPGPQI